MHLYKFSFCLAERRKTWKKYGKIFLGYEGLYQVSTLGKIRGLDRYIHTKNKYYDGARLIKGSIIIPRLSNRNYLRVALYENGKSKMYSVHRLVAETFISNPNNLLIINHIDGNTLNNSVSNLEWCTQSHNVKESYRLGLQLKRSGKDSCLSKPVNQYDKNYIFIKKWDCIKEASKSLNIDNGNISKCCKGAIKTAGGYIWKYAD